MRSRDAVNDHINIAYTGTRTHIFRRVTPVEIERLLQGDRRVRDEARHTETILRRRVWL